MNTHGLIYLHQAPSKDVTSKSGHSVGGRVLLIPVRAAQRRMKPIKLHFQAIRSPGSSAPWGP